MKLADIPFRKVAKSGEELKFIAKVTVTTDGVFYATVPDAVKEVFKAAPGVERHRQKLRFSGQTLDEIKQKIGAAIDEYLKFSETSEQVILYAVDATCSYCLGKQGIYANGGPMKDAEGDYKWAPILTTAGAIHRPSMFRGQDWMLALRAAPRVKVIHTRGTIYRRVQYVLPCYSDKEWGPWAEKLNGFTHVSFPEEEDEWQRECREMAYTETAARFFYESMISMCHLAARMTDFFGEEQQATKRIMDGGRLLNAHNLQKTTEDDSE